MVTASSGVATFLGNGRTFGVAFYIADVDKTVCLFDAGSGIGATTGLAFYSIPENCVLKDISVNAGPTVTKFLVMTSGGAQIPGQRINLGACLATNPQRPPLSLRFGKGSMFGLTEAV